MGNSIEKYHFESPKFGDYDLSRKAVYIIDDFDKGKYVQSNYLCKGEDLYVDCEGHYFGNPNEGRLCLVQIAIGSENCFIFVIVKCPQNLSILKTLFESAYIRKVFHDCSGDASILYDTAEIILKNVDDTQIAQKVIEYHSSNVLDKGTGWSLCELYARYMNKSFPSRGKLKGGSFGENIWYQRPLTEKMVKYAAVDAFALLDIFPQQLRLLNSMPHLSKKYKTLVIEQLSKKMNVPSVYTEFEEEPDSSGNCIIS